MPWHAERVFLFAVLALVSLVRIRPYASYRAKLAKLMATQKRLRKRLPSFVSEKQFDSACGTSKISIISSVFDIPNNARCHWSPGGSVCCASCSASGVCEQLQRRKLCRPFRRDTRGRRVEYEFGMTPVPTLRSSYSSEVYHQARCHVGQPCFDLSRCAASGTLALYVYPGGPENAMLAGAAASLASDLDGPKIAIVDTPAAACLLVVGPNSFATNITRLLASDHWEGGRNHLIWDSSRFHNHGDQPLHPQGFGLAALASGSLTMATHRSGFDIMLPIHPNYKMFDAEQELIRNMSRPRPILLSFRGGIITGGLGTPGYQHRYIAAEYLHDPENGVIIEIACPPQPGRFPATDEAKRRYVELLLDSIFGFTFGGAGEYSFRFCEVLYAGGIPVVTSDLVLPFEPEAPWDNCVVRVDESELVTVPRRLRDMRADEIAMRRHECARLRDLLIGGGLRTPPAFQTQLGLALRLWGNRIKRAKHQEGAARSIFGT